MGQIQKFGNKCLPLSTLWELIQKKKEEETLKWKVSSEKR